VHLAADMLSALLRDREQLSETLVAVLFIVSVILMARRYITLTPENP
jgi:hypothetical protein